MTDQRDGKIVVVFGSTGTAGSGAVKACLDDPLVAEVRAVTRRPLGLSHDRLVEVMCADFSDLSDIAESLRGVDTVLYCLGISATKVDGEDEYREIHVTFPLAAARTLLSESPQASFVLLSGAGAKRTSRMMWARVKAEAEDALAELSLARQACVRPGGILPMEPTGAARWIMRPMLKVAPGFGIGAKDLGRAMLRVGLDESVHAASPLENKELRKLADL